METNERSPEIHSIPDVSVWLTHTDGNGEGISHASAQCPSFAEGAKAGLTLTTETEPTGWLCGYCTDHVSTVMANSPLPGNVDAPNHGPAAGSGTTPGGGASEKQVALIERLCTKLGEPVPVYHSKKQASAEIDRLMELERSRKEDELVEAASEGISPEAAEVWLRELGRKVEPADVTKGLQLAATLWAAEWHGDFAYMVDMAAAAKKGLLTPGQAKGVLNCWRADLNRRPAAKPAAAKVTEDGMYRMADGTIVKVQVAHHGSGELYAKRLVIEHGVDSGMSDGHFEYERGLVSKLTPEMRMTLEQAKEFGRLYGVCCKCAAVLTDEHSIAEGIGPICAGKGWA